MFPLSVALSKEIPRAGEVAQLMCCIVSATVWILCHKPGILQVYETPAPKEVGTGH